MDFSGMCFKPGRRVVFAMRLPLFERNFDFTSFVSREIWPIQLLLNILADVNDAKIVRIHECFRGRLSIVLPCLSEWELPKA
jgi:hypothetical protein